MSDKYKNLASNTAVLMLGQFFSKMLVYIMMRFYTAMLGTGGYGAVGNIIDVSTLAMGIFTLSIGESVIRFASDIHYDKRKVFTAGIITTVCGAVLFAAFIPTVSMVSFLHEYAFLIFLYTLTGSVKSTCALFIRSSGRVKLYAIDGVLTTAVNIILNIVLLATFNLGVTGYVLSVVFADLFSIVFLTFAARLWRYVGFRYIDKPLWNDMFRFCLPLIPTAVMWWVTSVSDSFFVTSIMGVENAGIYKAAYKLPSIIALVSGIFSQAWNLSAIGEQHAKDGGRFYTNVFNQLQSAIYCLAAGMLLFIKPVLGIMTAGGFEEAYRYTPMLILAVVFSSFSTFCGSVYIVRKKTIRSMTTVLFGAVLNLILNAVLIPNFGLNGAAAATLASYLLVFVLRASDTRRIMKMRLYPAKMVVSIGILAAMGVVVAKADGTLYWIELILLSIPVLLINVVPAIHAVISLRRKPKPKNHR
ncbi:MAG: polysaccharide biosynthesis C-terminal domain-containing protein [Oscillospiraceae bacterium]|jgi:O-antigen/teichoic acid export membrane protein|nr:polysaccharide biosynthesis C-terminal domain-containing protein [Oscillospiraceae bacterium]